MDEIAEQCRKSINRLWKEFNGLFHEIALQLNLSDSAFCVLYAIDDFGGGCMQKEISIDACLSKQTVNSSVLNMKKKGIVYFKPGKGHDKLIYLTDSGKQLVSQKITPIKQLERDAYNKFSTDEYNLFLGLMAKYINIVKDKSQQIKAGIINL